MLTKRPKRQCSSEIINLDNMIPENHFLRVIEKYFDWNFIYDEVEHLYSKQGNKSIDPVVLFKIHILKFLFHEDSLRKTYETLQYNLLYRWFIGYEINEEVPNHSTYSQNYKRKFCKLEKDLLQTVFDKVIELLIEWNCLDMTAVYIDSTHTKAYANKKKHHKEIVKTEIKKYQKELDLEIALKGLQEENLTDEEYLNREMLDAWLMFTGGTYKDLVNMAIKEHEVRKLIIKSREQRSSRTIKVVKPTGKANINEVILD